MLIYNVKVPFGGSIVVNIPFKKTGVRRLIMNSTNANISLLYDSISIIETNSYTSLYELQFESYYGYPDASKFKLVNYGTDAQNVRILIDTVPDSPINEDYFKKVD